jgi:hypothetical protein
MCVLSLVECQWHKFVSLLVSKVYHCTAFDGTRVRLLDVKNENEESHGQSFSTRFTPFVVKSRSCGRQRGSRRAQKKNEESREAQEPTLESGVYSST